jgi:hypothetical protein
MIAAIFLTGCENLCLESRCRRVPAESRPVYVTNPELSPEYGILRASHIYPITSNSNGVSRLTLKPLAHGGGCGLGILLTVYTLGIVPVEFHDRYGFLYDLETDGVVDRRVHHLPVYSRISIWDALLKPFHPQKRILAKALARSPAWRSSDSGEMVPVHPGDVLSDERTPAIQQRPKGPL